MLKGRCALVTGSLGGIGFATAGALANRGCDVMIHGLSDAKHAEDVRAKLAEATGVKVAVSSADLAHLEEIDQLVEEAQAALGPIDILVNNAVTRHAGPVEEMPIATWSLALAVNLTAPFRLIQLTLPGMKKRGWGRIINIASNWGVTGTRNRSDYVATKHGLVGLTRAVALEALPFGVTCVDHQPGVLALQERCKGFTDGFAPGKVKYVPTTRDPTAVKSVVKAALASDATIDTILTLTASLSGEPAIAAVKETGMKVNVGSFDLSPGLLKLVAAGDAAFAIDQQQFLQGYLPVVFLANYVRYGLLPAGNVHTGPNLITKDKAAQVIALSAKGIR